MLCASLLFTLLEGSRYIMLGMMAVINSQSVTESVFAEYQVPAYQNYHLLLLDSGYGTGELQLSEVQALMQKLGQENLNPEISGYGKYSNFLQMNVTDCSVVQYELATDDNAGPLLRQIAQIMKKEAAADLVKKITDVSESDRQGKKADKYLDGALDTIERAKEEAQTEAGSINAEGVRADSRKVFSKKNADLVSGGVLHGQHIQLNIFSKRIIAQDMSGMGNIAQDISGMENSEPETVQTEISEQEIENPMEDVKSAKSSPLLAQILSEGDSISAKQMAKGDAVEQRTLHTGNYVQSSSSGIADKILTVQYLKKYTSDYRHSISVSHALEYEKEYILFGKYTDEDNLEKMASRLLLLREGINFAYLLTDQAKCEEALAMAAVIAAAAGIPGAVKAIQMGLLASWAYSESIAELRTLFSGGKISAVKSSDSWTVSLAQTAAVLFDHSVKSREVSSGLDYEDYLDAFLILENLDKIGIRFANLLEKNIRLYAGYEQVKLDCMITAMETESSYQAGQMFLSFVTVAPLSKAGYELKEKYAFSYMEK